jgi:hypothetical protein
MLKTSGVHRTSDAVGRSPRGSVSPKAAMQPYRHASPVDIWRSDMIQSPDPEVLATDMIRHFHILAGVCRSKFTGFRHVTTAAQAASLFVLLAVGASLIASKVTN